MKVKVINRNNPGIYEEYENVINVIDTFDENKNYCHQIQMEDKTTATYPAIDWAFFSLEWTPMF